MLTYIYDKYIVNHSSLYLFNHLKLVRSMVKECVKGVPLAPHSQVIVGWCYLFTDCAVTKRPIFFLSVTLAIRAIVQKKLGLFLLTELLLHKALFTVCPNFSSQLGLVKHKRLKKAVYILLGDRTSKRVKVYVPFRLRLYATPG